MSKINEGSCLCGQVLFAIDGEFETFFLCHCKFCQKDTGSAHGANLFSTKAKIEWLSGRDKIKTFNLPSTRHVKSFCIECGSALPTEQVEGGGLVVPAGSLDTDVTLQPRAHIFFSSKVLWYEKLDEISKVDKFPNFK